jgi:hypothetical protein
MALAEVGRWKLHTLPPKLSPEEEREQREMVTWHTQKGLHFAKQNLERANSNQQREAALKEIQIFTEMLERNKEKQLPRGMVKACMFRMLPRYSLCSLIE